MKNDNAPLNIMVFFYLGVEGDFSLNFVPTYPVLRLSCYGRCMIIETYEYHRTLMQQRKFSVIHMIYHFNFVTQLNLRILTFHHCKNNDNSRGSF